MKHIIKTRHAESFSFISQYTSAMTLLLQALSATEDTFTYQQEISSKTV